MRFPQILLQALIVIAIPVVLIVMPVRALMHPRWVLYEYSRPDFPADPFGFAPAERTRLAITGVESIVGPRGVVVLREARLADGSPAFVEREVSHMQDVRVVTGNIYVAQAALFIAAAIALIVLARSAETRPAAPAALLTGATVTIVLLVALVLTVLIGFDTFFTTFHRVFFTGDTWLFNASDTLIRLYPPQFWFEAATVIGAATILEATVLGIVAWLWGKAIR